MEDWEEGSVIESCRSSVISDLDELEANLYGIIHHEVNEEVNESFSHALSVLPVSDGEEFWRTKENVLDAPEPDVKNSKIDDLREENETCSDQKEKKVALHEGRGRDEEKEKGRNNVNENLAMSSEHDFSIEYADSRYNVGCAYDNSKDKIATTSSNTFKPGSELSTLSKQEGNIPVVIDVLSSEEEQEVIPIKTVSLSKKHCSEEVVVLDDSDGDVMIEMEKVKVRRKKRKKISDDIQLNTVNSGKIRRLGNVSNPHTEDAQPYSPAPNIFSTPMKELDLSTICKSWTPEMINFYEDSWGGENWSLNELLSSMSDNGWQLDVTDQFSSLPGRPEDRRYFGNFRRAWCSNCNRKGHSRHECVEEKRPQKCRRCGSLYHTEYSCEERICLSCGKETQYFTKACRSCQIYHDKGSHCGLCSVKGHASKRCPDLWRRYHATVVPGRVICPKKVLYKSSMNLYCCNCATKGHHVFQCKKKTLCDYIPQNPKVITYDNPSSPTRETDPLAISENWDKRRLAAPEKGFKETPKSRKKVSERSSSKLKIQTENSKESMASKLKKAPIEFGNSIPSVSEAADSIAPKKKKSKKKKIPQDKQNVDLNTLKTPCEKQQTVKKKKKLPKDKQNLDLNTLKTPCAKQSTVRNDPNSIKKSNNKEPTNNFSDQITWRSTSKLVLTKKEYQMLNAKQGEEVLKYVSKEEPRTAITVLHTGVKMLQFIGSSRRSVMRSRRMMVHILRNNGAWKEITGSAPGNETVKSKERDKQISSEVRVKSEDKKPDLRVKINNCIQSTSRDVISLPVQVPEYSRGPKNNVMKRKNKKNNSLQQKEKKVDPEVRNSIRLAARCVVKGAEGVTASKVKDFASWAFRSYGSLVDKKTKYELKTLSNIRENASIEAITKFMMSIIKG